MIDKNSSLYPYPINLFRDIYELQGRSFTGEVKPDQLKGLEILIGAIPNEKYKAILFERYKDKKTYEEIGKEHNFTGSRAGQLVKTILKKLAFNRASGLLMGYDEFVATSTIDILELSTRAERALLRNEINTLEDIKFYGKENIRNLRNVGETTINEIMEKTWFLWDEDDEKLEKLSDRQKERITVFLEKKGWRKRDITIFVRYIDDSAGM